MPEQLFTVTRRTPFLVNRVKETGIIRKAIYAPSKLCHVVFVYGEGGMGKSRLVEEVLWRAGNSNVRDESEGRGPVPDDHSEWDWTQSGNAFVGNIIDLTDTALHTRTNLMEAIRNAFVRAVPAERVGSGKMMDFSRYDAAHNRLERLQQFQGDYQYITEQRSKVEDEFFSDFGKNAKERRLVLVFDTAEKLFTFGSPWLYEKNLLRDEDLAFSALHWLAEQIKRARFANATLVFVGRKEEGSFFFNSLRSAAEMVPGTCQLDEIELLPFKASETGQYIAAWIDAYRDNPDLQNSMEALKIIQNDPDKLEVLQLYTGGQPVRLALYIDLIVEGITIPDPLNDTLAQARQRCQTDDPERITPELVKARSEIESEFIKLLFVRPTLRSQILKTLVRSSRGLGAGQLDYILGSNKGQPPESWLAEEEHALLKDIKQELEFLKRLSIVKMRPDGRFGLQDEIYRIYAQHMRESETDQQDETQARQEIYKKLEAWAKYQLEQQVKSRNEFQLEDLRSLRFHNPANALSTRFPVVSEHEEEKRREIRRSIQAWELENVHYALLVDPVENINSKVFDHAYKFWLANDEDADVVAQGELWQVFNDKYLLEFANIKSWVTLDERHEQPIEALRRVVEQADLAGWIMRFINRRNFDRALEFYSALEKEIEVFPDALSRQAWLHTSARGERKVWACYAHFMKSENVTDALTELDQTIKDMERLLQAGQFELAIPETGEKGLRGHPAEDRLLRILALAHNFLGYGYMRSGKIRSGILHYGRALKYLREVPFLPRQAIVRNNLSAALTVRGYTRARRLCLDGLSLRMEEGAEVPLGYSYNTLALIDNDNQRPDLAWVEAATALAYFNLAEEPRGQGLTLLQLGEALRRLAKLGDTIGYVIPDRAEAIYSEAKKASNQAIDIFTNTPASKEPSRLAEAYIERGCLERDLIVFNKEYREKPNKQTHYQEAIYYLELAANLASQYSLLHLHLDALDDMAWAHFYAGHYTLAETSLAEAEGLLPKDCLITEQGPHPVPSRDDFYVYQLLSKMYGLRGRMAMQRFWKRQEQIYDENRELELGRFDLHKKIGEDEKTRENLQQAAEYFILALAYSQLLSPRSNALTVIYNLLYDYLKKFNTVEMNLFAQFEGEARKKYKTSELKLEDLGNPDDFLRDSFGIEIEEG